MVWSCVLYAVVRRRFCRMCIHAHAHLLTLNEQALGRLQGRVGKLPRRHSLIFICARIRFMVLFVLCRFYIFGLMIKLFKHMEKCVCVWRVWLHVRYARHVLMLGRWWFSFAVGLFFKFFWLSFWNVHILLWSPQTFVTTFQRVIRSLTQNGTHSHTYPHTQRVDFTRALTFQPTNLILLANSIGCALMLLLLHFSNSFVNSL